MSIKDIVNSILKEKDRPLAWLAKGMRRTDDGLRAGLTNESVKYKDLLIMAKILEVSPSRLFETKDEQPNLVREPSVEYGNLKHCEELVISLKNQINDKERIISLLSRGNIDADQSR